MPRQIAREIHAILAAAFGLPENRQRLVTPQRVGAVNTLDGFGLQTRSAVRIRASRRLWKRDVGDPTGRVTP
jgi:hypothetical protein